MPTGILLRTLTLTTLLAVLATGASAQRIWLDEGLSPCARSNARFYLEPDGNGGPPYPARIFTLAGVVKGSGQYADPAYRIADGDFTYFYPDGKVESKGRFVNGRKDGVWQRYDPRGGELAEKVYDMSHLANLIHTLAQTMPEFPGGEKAMVRYLKDELGKTPRKATATFVVERNGQVGNVEVSGVEDETLKEKIVTTINAAPRWQAGVQDGQPVRVKVRVPLN